jgi:hypothetical protein
MGCTVFANDMGFFHKGSGGTGKAFPDVCLSPPPAPTGPVPVPYPNSLQASDLENGSKTVKFQGEPTALEDASDVSTSTGDEAGNQGGNVVTHKTKGKGYFTLWSFDVKVEGKGVGRHGDPMEQNCASQPPGAMAIMAQVAQAMYQAETESNCTEAYNADRHRHAIVEDQRRAVDGGPCWQCGSTSPAGLLASFIGAPGGIPAPAAPGQRFTPDHVPPVVVRWYLGGCNQSPEDWKDDFQDPNSVRPHCAQCSDGQGGLSGWSQMMQEMTGAVRSTAAGLADVAADLAALGML